MDIEKVFEALDKRKSLHDNDLAVEKQWEKLTLLLTENIDDTISLFDTCTEEQILWLSEVFEDIAYKFQDVRFIECLDRVFEKYPKIPIGESIKTAKQFML